MSSQFSDAQTEILRQVLQDRERKLQQRLRDCDSFAKRRARFMWAPYSNETANVQAAREKRGLGAFELISKFGDPAILLAADHPQREFWLAFTKVLNRPAI